VEQLDERAVVFRRTERVAFSRSPRVDVRVDSSYVGATESDLD